MTIDRFKEYLLSSKEFSFNSGVWYSSNSSKLSYPKEGYDNCFELEENSFWFRHRNNCLVSVIKKYSPHNLFFDIGGGNGFVSKAIDNAQISVVLVEPGKAGVLNAKKRDLKNIVCGTLNDLNGLIGRVDAIGAFDVIEHIEDDNKFVKEIHTMLKNEGFFFVTVPAFQFLWSNEDRDAGHFKRYSQRNILKLLRENGFELIYSTYFFSFLLIPLFIVRTLPSKLGIRRKSKTQTQREHNQNNGFIGKVFDLIWNWELGRIQRQKSIPFGTSCLIVARKK